MRKFMQNRAFFVNLHLFGGVAQIHRGCDGLNTAFFVQNVKGLCRQKGVSVSAACDACGAGRSLLANMSRGSMPSIEKVDALAHYLGVTVSDLLGEDSVGRSGDALRVADAYSTAPAAMQAAVRKLLGIAE